MKDHGSWLLRMRWLMPAAITCIALCLLVQKSPAPTLFRRYDAVIVALFLAFSFWAAVCWWCALDEGRFSRLARRASTVPFFGIIFVVMAAIFLVDLLVDISHDALVFIDRNSLVVTVFCVAVIAVTTAILATKQPRKALLKVALLLSVFAMVILCVEALFRWLLVEYQVPRNTSEFETRVAGSWPHSIAIEKDREKRRVIGLSDSFGLAGDSENYHYRLERALAGSMPPYDVVNFSVSGYELAEELTLLTRFGARYNPDVVLHGVFVGNDFWGSTETTKISFRGMPLELPSSSASLMPGKYLLRQIFGNIFVALRDLRKKEQESNDEISQGTFSHSGFLDIEKRRLAICLRSSREDEEFWGSVAGVLDEIRAQCRGFDAEYVMVIHPDQFQVEGRLFEELVQRFGLDPRAYDLDQPQSFLRGYCSSRRIHCVDLLPVFRQHGGEGGLYLLDDTHYSDRGNELATEQILPVFTSGVLR